MKTTTTTVPHYPKIIIDLVFMVLSLLILALTRRSARLGIGYRVDPSGIKFTPLTTTLRLRDTLGIRVTGVVVGPVRLGPTVFVVVPVLVTRFQRDNFYHICWQSY